MSPSRTDSIKRKLFSNEIRISTEIDVTPDALWVHLEPIEDHVDWMHDAVAIRFLGDQTRGVGTAFLCDTKVGPIKLVDRMEITEWEPGASMGVRHSGLVTGEGRFTLTPIDRARRTRFTWTETLHFPWFLGGPVGEFIGGKLVLKAIWRRNLRNLKRLVEG